MYQLFKSALFGVDMRNCLKTYIAITMVFFVFGHRLLPWPWWLVCIATVGFYSIFPDFDLLPYRMIVKGKERKFVWFAISVAVIAYVAGLWLKISALGALAYGLGMVAWSVHRNAGKVLARGSHWPIMHYPAFVILFGIFFTGGLANQYMPDQFWYLEALTIIPLVEHFAHDSVQKHGFPLFSLRQRRQAHWNLTLKPFKLQRVPVAVTRRFYDSQARNLHHQTGMQDLHRRADPVTWESISTFAFLLALSLAETYVLAHYS